MYKKINILMLLSFLFPISVWAQLQFDEATALEIPVEQYLTNPTPSPDGRYLAFSTAKYQGIYLFDLADGTLNTLTETPSSGWRFKWNTTSESIAYRTSRLNSQDRKEHALAVIEVGSLQQQLITEWDQQAQGLPEWTSSGSEIAFNQKAIQTDKTEKPRLYNTKVEKANAFEQPTTGFALQFTDASIWQIAPNQEPEAIYENPNGYPILNVHRYEDEFAVIEEVGSPLLRINLKTNAVDTLAPGEEASISPDGKTLLYRYSMDDGHNYIYSEIVAMDIQSGEILDRFSSSSLMPFNPVWKANGRGLYFSDLLSGKIYELSISGVEE
jgi:Tol biopolymer transport system component